MEANTPDDLDEYLEECEDPFLHPLGLPGESVVITGDRDRDQAEYARAWAVIAAREERRNASKAPISDDVAYCIGKAHKYADDALSLLDSRFDRQIKNQSRYDAIRPLWERSHTNAREAVFSAINELQGKVATIASWLVLQTQLREFVLAADNAVKRHFTALEEIYVAYDAIELHRHTQAESGKNVPQTKESVKVEVTGKGDDKPPCPFAPLEDGKYYKPKDFAKSLKCSAKSVANRYDQYMRFKYPEGDSKTYGASTHRNISNKDIEPFWDFLYQHPIKGRLGNESE